MKYISFNIKKYFKDYRQEHNKIKQKQQKSVQCMLVKRQTKNNKKNIKYETRTMTWFNVNQHKNNDRTGK